MRDCLSLLQVEGSTCCWYYWHSHREFEEGDSRLGVSVFSPMWLPLTASKARPLLLAFDYSSCTQLATYYYFVAYHLSLFFLPFTIHLFHLALITILISPVWLMPLVWNLLLLLLQQLSCFIIPRIFANTSCIFLITFCPFSFNLITKEKKK